MALYEYDLYLIREAIHGEIARDLQALHLLELVDGSEGQLPIGVHVTCSESTNSIHPETPLQIMTLSFESSEFEELLKQAPGRFFDWLWLVAGRANIAYAFMSSGSYAAYYQAGRITSEAVFRQVGEVVATGKIRIVHPLMFFAERIGGGRACAAAEGAPMYHISYQKGVGCLLLIADGDPVDGPLEILDPGTLYDELRHHFDPSGSRGRA